MWIHFNFYFKKPKGNRQYGYFGPRQFKVFRAFLRSIILYANPFILRSFYLFEPDPHCFLALELKYKRCIEEMKMIANEIEVPKFLRRIEVTEDTKDEANKEGFLNMLNAMTEFNLFYRDNKLTHIIHCCLNQSVVSLEEEISFYKGMVEKEIKYLRILKKRERK